MGRPRTRCRSENRTGARVAGGCRSPRGVPPVEVMTGSLAHQVEERVTVWDAVASDERRTTPPESTTSRTHSRGRGSDRAAQRRRARM
jgi:hypothetical protein